MWSKVLKIVKDNSMEEIFLKILHKVKDKNKYFYEKHLFFELKKSNDFICFEPKTYFFYSIDKKNEIKKLYNKNLEKKDEVIKEANRILNHEFNLLGSGLKKLGEKINWSEDFKTGFIWEKKFYKDIKIVDLNNNSDVKVPWEVSRFQHLFCLGKAYWITDEKKYYTEFKEQILDWIDENPYCMTVNWTCAMDVAIRSVNWIHAYYHFENLMNVENDFKNKFNNSLYKHGKFIFRNLEKNIGPANNHYLSNLVGLIYLGLFFEGLNNGLKEPKKWLKFGIKELKKEMFIQNNEDGTNYETSTSYHRLVTELFLYTTLLAEQNGISFSKEYKARLEKMNEFLMGITKPNGFSSLIGDVDDGRLIIMSNYYDWNKRDLNNTLGIAGLYFNREDFKAFGERYFEENLWISGRVIKNKTEVLKLKSNSYENGGFYVLRSKSIYCIIRCGELSLRGQGGHSHNDQLSIELNIFGKDFFIDPGVDVYTSDYKSRNKFRSTKMHNTVIIEECEQNNFEEKQLFKMREQSFGRCLRFTDSEFEGEHYGYKEQLNIVHNRRITLQDKSLILQDTIGEAKGKINFILDENIRIVVAEDDKIILKNADVFLKISNIGKYKIEDEIRAIGYGNIVKTKKITIELMKSRSIFLTGEKNDN